MTHEDLVTCIREVNMVFSIHCVKGFDGGDGISKVLRGSVGTSWIQSSSNQGDWYFVDRVNRNEWSGNVTLQVVWCKLLEAILDEVLVKVVDVLSRPCLKRKIGCH